MSRNIIMASHGTLAQGMKNTIEIILGSQPHLYCLCAYVKDNDDISLSVAEAINQFPKEDEIIIVTDIFGGSVNNEFMKYLTKPTIHLIAGLNLPLMIQLITNEEQENTAQFIDDAIKSSSQSIQYCNHTLNNSVITDNDF